MTAGARIVRVAYQGAPGAFSAQAIEQRWSGRAHTLAMRTFDDVLASVEGGEAHFGVVPVWNSTMGELAMVRDAMRAQAERARAAALRVVDEVEVSVRHHLLAIAGVSLADLRHVTAHPAALAQCRRFLASHTWLNPRPAWDSAGAAAELARAAQALRAGGEATGARPWFAPSPGLSPATTGVLASRVAADAYDLVVLRENVQDRADNATRFAIVARPKAAGAKRW